MSFDTDVLISGAGPTGLMLACQLARHNVPFVIVDKNDGPSVTSKAMVVQARTLELYDQMGIASQALEAGHRARATEIHIKGKHVATLPLGDIGKNVSPFPFVLNLGQDQNERILGEKLKSMGAHVQWKTELVDFKDNDGITSTLRCGAESKSLRSRFIVGCDGAHSAVRHVTKIDFPGAPYEQVFFVADITARGIEAHRNLNIFIQPAGFHLLFPLPGDNHFRLIGILPEEIREKADLTFQELTAALAPQLGDGFTIVDHGWWSRYRISHRCARTFRKGRALLAGDAGHIHSPAGGQGMNTGLQDACNLAWKLALVCKGTAPEGLLDSYCEERERVAQNLVSTTDRAFTLAVSQRFFPKLFRSQIAARVAGRMTRFEWVRRKIFGTVSQTRIQYRSSSISVNEGSTGTVRAGDRLPWHQVTLDGESSPRDIYSFLKDISFHLFLFDSSQEEVRAALEWKKAQSIVVGVHVIRDCELSVRHGIGAPSVLLVRPDGYIGYCASHFTPQKLGAYLRTALITA